MPTQQISNLLLIKIGGSSDLNWDAIAHDISELDRPVLIVHGANQKMDELTKKQGNLVRTITSPSGYTSRYSDDETMDIFLQAYCGVTNKRLVATLLAHGINAVGLSGIDGHLWLGKEKKHIIGTVDTDPKQKQMLITDSHTGNIFSINTELLELLLSNSYTPVLTAPAISTEHTIINVDNDRAVAQLIKALNINEAVSLFSETGLLRDFEDKNSVIKTASISDEQQLNDMAQGRMKKKVLGAKEAFEAGLETMYWGDGRVENPVSNALAGSGTILTP